MTERWRGLDDDALGRALAATAREIEWPAMPDVSGRVAETLRDQQRVPSLARPRLSLPRRNRTVLLVVVGVVLLSLAAVAAKVVIDLGALTIDTIPGLPTALPSAVASGPTLGHPATLPDAEREAGFTARVPDALGSPDAVWVDETPDGTRIVLGWKPRVTLPPIDDLPWGAVLYEFHGDAALASKLLFTEGNTIQQVEFDGHDAWWIAGPHELDLVTGEGTYSRYRVAGNVLVWKNGDVVMRLETTLDRAAAIRVAQSIPA
jgi:hypothetical protein